MKKKLFIITIFILLLCSCGKVVQEKKSNWQKMEKLTGFPEFQLEFTSDKERYQIGESIKLNIKSKRDGNLWIVVVNPLDEVSLIFPNDFANDNEIIADEGVTIPPDNAEWNIKTKEPEGKHLIVAIVADKEADISKILPVKIEKTAQKDIRINKKPLWQAKSIVVNVGGE